MSKPSHTYKVYKITNTKTDKLYIGVSNNPKRRFNDHCSCALNGKYDTYFYRSIIKYGRDNFTLEILSTHDTQEGAYQEETVYIESHNTLAPNGYNSNSGGKGGMSNPSKETRQKLSDAKQGYTPWNKDKTTTITTRFNKKSNEKFWLIIKKDGTSDRVKNLREYCDAHNYKQPNLNRIMNLTLKTYKDIKEVRRF